MFVDGQPITSLNLKSLRSLIGVVSQEPKLFSMTVKECIAMGTWVVSRPPSYAPPPHPSSPPFLPFHPPSLNIVSCSVLLTFSSPNGGPCWLQVLLSLFRTRTFGMLLTLPAQLSLSTSCKTSSTRTLESGAGTCRVAKSSASPSPVLLCATLDSCCWTKLLVRWIRAGAVLCVVRVCGLCPAPVRACPLLGRETLPIPIRVLCPASCHPVCIVWHLARVLLSPQRARGAGGAGQPAE